MKVPHQHSTTVKETGQRPSHPKATIKSSKALPRKKKRPTVQSLGWTKEEALETYYKFRAFAEDWDDPAMEVYDDI